MRRKRERRPGLCLLALIQSLAAPYLLAGKAGKKPEKAPWKAPDAAGVTFTDPALLQVPEFMAFTPEKAGYVLAETAPEVTFAFYPEQTEEGAPWSAWGNGCVYKGKYYSAIGDHRTRALVYAYDPATPRLSVLLDVKRFLGLPEDHYTPGKIHSFITPGKDGRLYFATHEAGKVRSNEEHHYRGDWLMRVHPETGKAEIICRGPVGKRSIPVGFLDPERMVFYGSTGAPEFFFAYDVVKRKLLFQSEPGTGATRNMLFSSSTGRVYFRKRGPEHPFLRYDPETGKITPLETDLDPRCSSEETAGGYIYAVDWQGKLWRLHAATEKTEVIGQAPIGKQTYTTSLPVSPDGRFLYYSCGAHGHGFAEGTPIVQFDTVTGARKVIAFLNPTLPEKTGFRPTGTYSLVLSEDGSTLFATWNGNRTVRTDKTFETCAMTAIAIPPAERPALAEERIPEK